MLSARTGLRAEERGPAWGGFAALLAIIAGHAMLETARDALFLADLPVTRLPYAYLAIAALALIAGSANAALLARFSHRRLLMGTLVLAALGDAVLCAVLFTYPAAHALFTLYVWTGLIATLVVVQFWLLLADAFDVSRAKRVFSVVVAGGLIGAVVGSLSAEVAMRFAHPRFLLLGGAAFNLLAAGIVAATLRLERRHGEAPVRRSIDLAAFGLLREQPYLRHVFLLVLLTAVVGTGADFVFKSVVVREIEPSDLGPFFARFNAGVSAFALLFQLLLASRVLQAIGVIRSLSVLPLLVLGAAGLAAATLGLAGAMLLKGADGALRHSLHRAGTEILFLPLDGSVRSLFKGLADSVGQRGGQALASLVLLGAVGFDVELRFIAAGVAVMAALWLTSLAGLRREYVERFRTQLQTLRLEGRGELPRVELHSLEELVSGLSSADDALVLASLDLLETLDRARLIPTLILYHPAHEVVLRALGIFERSGRVDGLQPLAPRLHGHPHTAVRAAALRLPELAPPVSRLREILRTDPAPEVRSAALASWLRRAGADASGVEDDVRALLEDGTRESALALARSAGVLTGPLGEEVVRTLLDRADPEIAAALSRALAERPALEHIPLYLELLGPVATRPPARQALISLGTPALEALSAALSDPRGDPIVRRHVPRTLSRFENQAAVSVLAKALDEELEARVAYKVLRGLGRMRADDPALDVPEEPVLAEAERSLERAVGLIAARLALELEAGVEEVEPGLLVEVLADEEQGALERAFRALHVLDPRGDYHASFAALASGDAEKQAGARELLEHLLDGPLREGVLALTEGGAAHERLAAARAFRDPEDADALLRLSASWRERAPAEPPAEELAEETARLAAKARARLAGDSSPVVVALARQAREAADTAAEVARVRA